MKAPRSAKSPAKALCLSAISLGLVALCVLLSQPLVAQEQGLRTLRSQSGQFIVRGLPVKPVSIGNASPDGSSFVRLDPAVLAIGCERIKSALLDELGLADNWKGSIQVNVYPYRRDNEPIKVASVRFKDGWSYFLEMPEVVERTRLLRAVVQALLGELANRTLSEQAADLPLWLLEGMPAHLHANDPDIVSLQLDSRIVKRHSVEEALKRVREVLRDRTALTIDELSWPSEGVDAAVFGACSQLFVHELLRLRGGKQCLARTILGAGSNLNWQTTFLEAFNPHFQRLVDVDKWWALSVTHLVARDPMSVWPLNETLAQLNNVLLTPAEVRTSPTQLPAATYLELPRVIAEWPWERQRPILQQKIHQLQALRLRAAVEALPVLDGYLGALQQYAYHPAKSSTANPKMELATQRDRKSELLRRLKQLDSTREQLARRS